MDHYILKRESRKEILFSDISKQILIGKETSIPLKGSWLCWPSVFQFISDIDLPAESLYIEANKRTTVSYVCVI